MDDKDLLQRIRTIVNDVPNGLHRYPAPRYWDADEWASLPPMEKGFIYIKELLEGEDHEANDGGVEEAREPEDIQVLNLGRGPRFWHHADEDMFFNALQSLGSFVEVKGQGRELFLHYRGVMTNEEKRFLVALLKRYQMKGPKDLREFN